jgi:PEP-CTERM motif
MKLLANVGLVLSLMLSGLPASAALFGNGGFETGVLDPWVRGIDASNPFNTTVPWTVSADAAHTGAFGATVIDNFELRQDFDPVATETISELSFWIRHPLEDFGGLALITLIYDTGFEDFFPAITESGAWTFFDLTSSLQPGLLLSGISVFGFTSAGQLVNRTDLDDVTLNVTVPEPAAIMFLVAGLAGIYVRKRQMPRLSVVNG